MKTTIIIIVVVSLLGWSLSLTPLAVAILTSLAVAILTSVAIAFFPHK